MKCVKNRVTNWIKSSTFTVALCFSFLSPFMTTSPPDLTPLLTAIGLAVQTLNRQPRQLPAVTARLLRELREGAGLDAAELYLADPPQHYLVRIGHSGPDQSAFSQRSFFEFGEGFPGLAAQSRTPLETQQLGHDERYLRSAVTNQGYQGFLSYPLLTPYAVVGVLNLATKNAQRLAGARQLLDLIAPLLANSLYAVMTSLGERTLDRVRRAQLGQERALILLQEHLAASGGQRATLRSVSPSGLSVETDPGAMTPCSAPCPAQSGKVCVTGLGDLHCAMMPSGAHLICLPIWDSDSVQAVASVEFAQTTPTREQLGSEALVSLLWLSRMSTQELSWSAPTAPKPWLELRTFGAFEVRREGQLLLPADFKRRQAYQLLKVLVTRWGRPVQMEELCAALWPDELVSEKVLARLHVTLNALRQVLEPRPEQRGQVLVRDGAAYRFAPTLPWQLDAAEFETLVHQADAQTGAQAIETYSKALTLYQGDYLENDPYADAFALERDYLRELAIHALWRCAELHKDAGRVQDTLTHYAQILATDPLRFDVHEALIGFLVSQGRHEEAQTRWERYAEAYGAKPPLSRPFGNA